MQPSTSLKKKLKESRRKLSKEQKKNKNWQIIMKREFYKKPLKPCQPYVN
jgi:hypothetical protein